MNLVTGATGFVGSHVARALLARGEAVRCLVRPGSRRDNLAELPVEVVEGDLRDPASLGPALHGARRVFHCAADYRLWASDPRELYRTNVDGTENLLRAAAAEPVERVVYTSSVSALGLRPDGTPADEETPVRPGDVVGAYKRSKLAAEQVARRWADRGLPVVIVNPSTPVGERDLKPTPTGQIVVDFLRRRMPFYVDTGLNLVDVRDVAEGHLLAAERGVPGRRYILGHRNLSLGELCSLLAELSGLPPPRGRLPHWMPLLAGAASSLWARATGRPPRVPLDGVRMARHRMFFDPRRAVEELGLPQSPVEPALDRAIRWFRTHGYAPAA